MDYKLYSVYYDAGIPIKMGTKDGAGYYKTIFDEDFFNDEY